MPEQYTLIPCPECHSKTASLTAWGTDIYHVKCSVCGKTGRLAREISAAVYYWNHPKTRAKRIKSESTIQKKIIKYLESIGCFVVKVVAANKSGTPDILACFNGHFIGIEVKKPGFKPTKLQQYKMDKIALSGGIAFVANSVEDVKQQLPDWLFKTISLTETADKKP